MSLHYLRAPFAYGVLTVTPPLTEAQRRYLLVQTRSRAWSFASDLPDGLCLLPHPELFRARLPCQPETSTYAPANRWLFKRLPTARAHAKLAWVPSTDGTVLVHHSINEPATARRPGLTGLDVLLGIYLPAWDRIATGVLVTSIDDDHATITRRVSVTRNQYLVEYFRNSIYEPATNQG